MCASLIGAAFYHKLPTGASLEPYRLKVPLLSKIGYYPVMEERHNRAGRREEPVSNLCYFTVGILAGVYGAVHFFSKTRGRHTFFEATPFLLSGFLIFQVLLYLQYQNIRANLSVGAGAVVGLSIAYLFFSRLKSEFREHMQDPSVPTLG